MALRTLQDMAIGTLYIGQDVGAWECLLGGQPVVFCWGLKKERGLSSWPSGLRCCPWLLAVSHHWLCSNSVWGTWECCKWLGIRCFLFRRVLLLLHYWQLASHEKVKICKNTENISDTCVIYPQVCVCMHASLLTCISHYTNLHYTYHKTLKNNS